MNYCEYHTLDLPVQAAQLRAWCKKRAGPIAAMARRVRSTCAAKVLGLTPQAIGLRPRLEALKPSVAAASNCDGMNTLRRRESSAECLVAVRDAQKCRDRNLFSAAKRRHRLAWS